MATGDFQCNERLETVQLKKKERTKERKDGKTTITQKLKGIRKQIHAIKMSKEGKGNTLNQQSTQRAFL